MQDKTIPDSDLTASSEWPGWDHGPRLARLNVVRSDYYQYMGAWGAHYKIVGEWIQVSVLLKQWNGTQLREALFSVLDICMTVIEVM